MGELTRALAPRLVAVGRKVYRHPLVTAGRQALPAPLRGRLGATKAKISRALHIRSLPLHPGDVWLASYPRSGNTWMRFMLAYLTAQDPADVDFDSIERYAPDMHVTVPPPEAGPRVIKTHYPGERWLERVVFMFRDPRDVAVSYFHYRRKLQLVGDDWPAFLEWFLTGRDDAFGTWADHANAWIARADDPRCLMLRYEDCKRDAAGALRQAAAFLGWETAARNVEAAAERASFDNMRALEQGGSGGGHIRGKDDSVAFVRAGSVAGWREQFTEAQAARLGALWAEPMRRLGYDPDERPTGKQA